MTTLASQKEWRETVADLLESLGDIPAARVRLHPHAGTATGQDVLDAHDRDNSLCELVDGVLVEKPYGLYESVLAGVLVQLLREFLDIHRLGTVTTPDGMMRLATGLVRIPDVAFIAWERFPGGRLPRPPIPAVAPDLAVEILSPSNTRAEITRKIREYFGAGTRLVWILDPESRTLIAYSAPDQSVANGLEHTISGGDVLPGFTLNLRDVFERADAHAAE